VSALGDVRHGPSRWVTLAATAMAFLVVVGSLGAAILVAQDQARSHSTAIFNLQGVHEGNASNCLRHQIGI
jgi:hypothetical protein